MSSDTIAAVATAVAAGEGSVSIVRISGPEAEAIGARLFEAPGHQLWESHRVLYGHVRDPGSGERLDEALLLQEEFGVPNRPMVGPVSNVQGHVEGGHPGRSKDCL